ncbi:MAG: hypothetical protein HYX79_02990 [Chloroflexi bacterium]|nr:hypothetical protein [Chloroflexota bacterium]
MPRINYGGREIDATDVDFQIRKEDWNEYQLMDGSIIKMKLVVSAILRAEGEYDNEGNPVYIVRSQNVMAVKAPDILRKKP